MTRKEFKSKYFTNNFYWVEKLNYSQLQLIGLEFGCLCHNGKKEIINWHEGFKNLCFRTYEKNNNVTVFQKEPFLSRNETATDVYEMLNKYLELDEAFKCKSCYNEFEEHELNEYGLCADCEQELQDEKQSILDTQQSLNKQF